MTGNKEIAMSDREYISTEWVNNNMMVEVVIESGNFDRMNVRRFPEDRAVAGAFAIGDDSLDVADFILPQLMEFVANRLQHKHKQLCEMQVTLTFDQPIGWPDFVRHDHPLAKRATEIIDTSKRWQGKQLIDDGTFLVPSTNFLSVTAKLKRLDNRFRVTIYTMYPGRHLGNLFGQVDRVVFIPATVHGESLPEKEKE